MAFQARSVILPIRHHGEAEALRGQTRELDQLLPLAVLAPVISAALVCDVASILPVIADRREEFRVGPECHRPQRNIDRLPNLAILAIQAVQWNTAISRAVVLAIR